jgi:iron complex outermembrane receptor protein
MSNRYLSSVAFVALLAGTGTAFSQSNAPAPDSVLLETIEVRSGQTGRVGVPTFVQQERRFIRRPGAETVISTEDRDPSTVNSIRTLFEATPGIYVTDRTPGSEGFISIRGSDIASSGPRGGRGVRAYIDGIPLGRNDAGLTAAFLNPNPAQYIEIYRGGSSLRYGSLSTGGAFNIVSKTGRSNPGSMVSIGGGSYGNFTTTLEHGGAKGAWDWFVQGSGYHNTGYQRHTRDITGRFDANIGYRPSENFETRFYLSTGSNNVELAQTVPLNQLRQLGRIGGTLNIKSDTDRNFHYTRLANKTTMRFDNTTVELGGYYLWSKLDHLPTPFSGIVDYTWNDFGVFGRVEHKTSLLNRPTEIVAGTRLNYTGGDFKQWTWANSGQDKGRLSRAWDFKGWLWENYGEAAVEVAPKLRSSWVARPSTSSATRRMSMPGAPLRRSTIRTCRMARSRVALRANTRNSICNTNLSTRRSA